MAKLADAVLPGPPSFDVTAVVMLMTVPVVAPAVTLTLNVHEPLAASIAPVRLMVLEPAVAAIVPPPQLPVKPLGVATSSPTGSVSEKPTPLSAVELFGLVIVKVKLVVPRIGMLVAPNALLMVGGAATIMVAVFDVAPAPLSVDVMGPVVLLLTPKVVPVTFTEKVHDPLPGNVPPERLMLLEATTAVMVPLPQEPLIPLGVATTRPDGSVSEKSTPVSAIKLFGLVIVKVKLVVPLSGMVAAPNALVMVGGTAPLG